MLLYRSICLSFFRAFPLASAKQKLCENAKKKELEKQQQRSARKKKSQICAFFFFAIVHWFQSLKPLGREKSKGLNKV
jgi:hypothetical protein